MRFSQVMYCPKKGRLVCALLLVAALYFPRAMAAQDEPSKALAVVDARIESSEDDPGVASNYEFMPGDFLYFQFEVAGFRITGSEDAGARRISLAYSIEIEDGNKLLLAPAQQQGIDEEITPQDKDWTPKRRVSILLPSYAAYGECRLRLTVRDLFAKTKVEHDYPFLLAGRKIEKLPSLAIQNLRFLRSDQDGPGLAVVAYRPGDTVWARFDMTGFAVGPGNAVQLSYDVSVLRPDGKVMFVQKNAAREKLERLFYPPQVVPGLLSVTTMSDLRHGEYTLIVRLQDEIGKRAADINEKFNIE